MRFSVGIREFCGFLSEFKVYLGFVDYIGFVGLGFVEWFLGLYKLWIKVCGVKVCVGLRFVCGIRVCRIRVCGLYRVRGFRVCRRVCGLGFVDLGFVGGFVD